ncbi:MAG: sugar ABC transporter ATP-binding protein [Lachnospiraceae bacterium]|nr:sugar ABC transporter ATP-binding protein [Lachnospiraceae bacterium]
MNKHKILEMKQISKSFSGVQVLNNVDLSLYPGEVRALAGENGAGKSTLMKILGGIYTKDTGEIYVDGKLQDISSVEVAKELGIAIIHQEIVLVQDMSIAENIFLGREHSAGYGLVNFRKTYEETQKLIDRLEIRGVTPQTMVKELSISQQQMVEIARALSTNARIIVMDEPTSSLTDSEVTKLFEQIRQLKKDGIAMIYISHKMDEIFEIADRITVMRDGCHIMTESIADTNYDQIIRSMVGHEITDYYPEFRAQPGDVILEVKNLTTDRVKDISFSIRKGEILGLSGLVGSGRTELAEALFGIDPIHSGEILLNGEKISALSPEEAIKAGIAMVPEDRKDKGLFLTNTINFNMTITVIDRLISKLICNKEKEKKMLDSYINQLHIKMANLEQSVIELSGGNQQKVVISKWLATEPSVLILDEPTRGIDVGAKSEIYHLMVKIAEMGVPIIMISSELPEIMNLSSKIAVMCERKLVKIFDLAEETPTQETIMHYATGGYRNEKK